MYLILEVRSVCAGILGGVEALRIPWDTNCGA